MKEKSESPWSKNMACGCNAEWGTWQPRNKMPSLLLILLSSVLWQGNIIIYVTVDLTIPLCIMISALCIMLLIYLLKGNKGCPATDLQGIFSLMPTNKVANYNAFSDVY